MPKYEVLGKHSAADGRNQTWYLVFGGIKNSHVQSRHSRESGNPEHKPLLFPLDSRFRGNDALTSILNMSILDTPLWCLVFGGQKTVAGRCELKTKHQIPNTHSELRIFNAKGQSKIEVLAENNISDLLAFGHGQRPGCEE